MSFARFLCSLLVADDLVDLEDLDEPVLMFNLQDRYMHDEIYVCQDERKWGGGGARELDGA
jgi:hypothetical protein